MRPCASGRGIGVDMYCAQTPAAPLWAIVEIATNLRLWQGTRHSPRTAPDGTNLSKWHHSCQSVLMSSQSTANGAN